jgi:hypothetical protein
MSLSASAIPSSSAGEQRYATVIRPRDERPSQHGAYGGGDDEGIAEWGHLSQVLGDQRRVDTGAEGNGEGKEPGALRSEIHVLFLSQRWFDEHI